MQLSPLRLLDKTLGKLLVKNFKIFETSKTFQDLIKNFKRMQDIVGKTQILVKKIQEVLLWVHIACCKELDPQCL